MSHDPYPIIGSLAPEAIEFGRMVDDDGRRTGRLRYNSGVHSIIFGKSGSGKDARLLIPNLLRMSGKRSIIAVDPKGEMSFVTTPQRKRLGNRVEVINPTRQLTGYPGYDYMEGCGFNPLCALNPNAPTFNKEAGQMGEAFIPMSPTEHNPFFPLSARALTGGLIMYEVCKAKEQNRVPSLINVRRMICEAAQEATPAMKIGRDWIPGQPASGIPAYAMEMANSIIEGMKNKGGQFANWTRELQGVASTARAETEFLDDPLIADNLTRNDFDFREVKRRPTTCFLILSSGDMDRYGKWLRLLLTSALQACMRPREGDEPDVLFIFNEFAALGHLQLIEDNFTVVRGAGIQMMPVLQDLGQLKRLYERWETFLANSDVTVTFAPNDVETAEYFSKRCGETTGEKITPKRSWSYNQGSTQGTGQSPNGGASINQGTSGGWTENISEDVSLEKIPAVTTADLYSMEPGEMRIVVAGMADTLHAHALPYFEQPSLKGLYQPNPYHDRLVRLPQAEPHGFGNFFGSTQGFNGSSRENESQNSGNAFDAARTDYSGIFDQVFGKGRAASPAPPRPAQAASAQRPQAPDTISRNVQARHPSFVQEAPKHLKNPAANHPGYAPDKPTGRKPKPGGDDWME